MDPGDKSGDLVSKIAILLAFAVIYFCWGGTYLAIRYAVQTIPPLLVAATRHCVAGIVLLGWCWRLGLRATRRQVFSSIVVGVLFFLIGHGSLHWAEQTIPSATAAVLVATEPIWIALF